MIGKQHPVHPVPEQQQVSPAKPAPSRSASRPANLVTEGSALADILADVLTPSPRGQKKKNVPTHARQPKSPEEALQKGSPLAKSAIAKKRRSVKDQTAAHALLSLFAR